MLFLILGLLFLILGLQYHQITTKIKKGFEGPFQVLKIIDGDTIEIVYDDNRTGVRLIGIDAPELGEPYSENALTHITNLLLNKAVYLDFDGDTRDIYGRLRAYLYRSPDHFFVNLEMVRQGLATADRDPRFKHKYMDIFQHFEKEAQDKKIGIWSK